MNGKLIVLTGVDGSGKTTQSVLLLDWLTTNGYNASLVEMSPRQRKHYSIYHDMKYGLLNQGIEMPPDIRAIILAFDTYVQICTEVIPLLNEGKIIITDRYIESTDIYLRARNIDCYWPNQILSMVPSPSISFNIDVDIDNCMRRIEKRDKKRQSHENYDTLQKIRSIFFESTERYKFVQIDGNQNQNNVLNSIISVLLKHKFI